MKDVCPDSVARPNLTVGRPIMRPCRGRDPGSNPGQGVGPVAQFGRAPEKREINHPSILVKLLPTRRNQVVEGSNPFRPVLNIQNGKTRPFKA